MATHHQTLLLLRLFRPSEVVKLTLSGTLLPPKGKGKGREDAESEARVVVGVVGNVENASGVEEGAIFILLPTSPSTLQILHLLPILPSTSLGISQRSSIPLTPGQTYAEFQANHHHHSTAASPSSPRPEKPSVEYVVSFRAEDGGEKVEIGVKDISEVEDLLREVKRLKGIKQEAEQAIGRRSGKGHAWRAYYSRTSELDQLAYNPSPATTSSDPSSIFEFHASASSSYLLAKLRDQHIRKSLVARQAGWTDRVPVRLHLATFNVNDSLPPPGVSLAPLVGVGVEGKEPADVLVFGFQELDLSVASLVLAPAPGQAGKTREEVWTESLLDGLGERKDEYEKLTSKQFVGVLIIILVKKDLRPSIGDVATDAVPIGLMGLMGNKAGVAVRMRVHGTYLTFVVAHLAAFADQLERRRQDYEEITKRLKFLYVPSEASKSVAHYGHEELAAAEEPFVTISSAAAGMVFWQGDLNYRVNLPDEEGWDLIQKKDVKALLLKDQLNHERSIGRVFAGFEEGEIRFPPSFKFEHGTHVYDSKRLPAWCDRVLFRPTEHDPIELQGYTSHPEVSFSDHQPVSADFEVLVRKIDHQRWKAVQDELGREADKLENEAVPTLEVSELNLDFGTVSYDTPVFRSIPLTNTRKEPAHFTFHPSDPSTSTLSHPWMWVHPSSGLVLPGEKEVVNFSVLVDDASAPTLNSGEEKIEDVLILRVEGGNDSFVSIEGDYLPTCFSNSLELLVRLPGPIRTIPRTSFFEELSPAENALSLPREIWRLVDWLMANAADHEGMFVQTTHNLGLVSSIRECLDTGAPFAPPSPSTPSADFSTAIAETLLRLLESLPEPVVPFGRSQETCAGTTSKDEAFQILDTLPNVSANTVIYLTSFLRYHLEKAPKVKGLAHKLAATFAHVLFRDEPGIKSAVDSGAKTRWVEFLLAG